MVQTTSHVRAGFSLMELMAYTVIVGLLMAGAGVLITNLMHNARVSSTLQALSLVKNQIESYSTRNDEYPSRLEDLKPKYLKQIPKDGWKNSLKYKVTEGGKHPYELYSYGSEGPGSPKKDHLSVWDK